MTEGPVLADTVGKVENRAVAELSQKLVLTRLGRCEAP